MVIFSRLFVSDFRNVPKRFSAFFIVVYSVFLVISAPNQLLSGALVPTVSVYSSSVCGLTCGQQDRFSQVSEHGGAHRWGGGTILSFINDTFISECVQVFSKRYAYQFLHRYTKNRLSETFPLRNHRRAVGPPDRTSDDRRRSRRRTPLRPPWNVPEYSPALSSAACERRRRGASPVSTSPR